MAKRVGPALSKPGKRHELRVRRNDEEGERKFHQGPRKDVSHTEAGYMTAVFTSLPSFCSFSLASRAGPYMTLKLRLLRIRNDA